MDVYKLAAVLSLEDKLSGPMGKALGAMLAAGAAVAGAGLKIGADWASATKTIVDGTGATGPALEQLQTDFQAVAHLGADEAATAIADLNTHLGLTGPELQDVSAMALKANIDTSKFGAVAEQAGLDVEGYKDFLDDLTVAGQATGVSTDQLLDTIGKNSARWQAGGGDVAGLTAHVVALASEFGPTGLRGAMSETMAEVDTGVMPTFVSLNTQLGDTTGAVEKTYLAGRTWRDVLVEVKDGAIAYAGPAGDMLAGVGSLGVALVTMGPHLLTMATNTGLVGVAQKALNLVMSLNPIGLVITAIGALVAVYVIWKDEINNFLKLGWNLFITAVEGGINVLRPLASLIGIDLPADMDKYKFATGEAETATTDAAAEIAVLRDEATTLAPAVKAAKVEIEAFDLSTVNMKTQIQQAKPEIKDIGDLLEAAGLQTGTSALEFGYYADEADILSGKMATHKTTIPPMILEMMTPPPGIGLMGEDTGNKWSAGFFASLQRSFEGGGGLMGGIKSSMTEGFGALFAEEGALAPVAEKWGQAMEAIGGIPVVGPFLAAFGPAIIGGVVALGKKAFNALKGIFGGPNPAVQAARGDLDSFAAEVEDRVGQTASSTERYQDFIAHGWEKNRALIITFFQDQAIASGRSLAESEQHWIAYEAAVEAGNSELAADLAQQAIDWVDTTSTAATDAETAWAASHTAQTVTSNTMTDEAIANSARLKEAVVADTVEMLAGWTTMVDGMQEGWTTTQTHVQDGSTEMLGSMQDGWIAFGVEHTTASGAMRDSWTETVTGMQDQAGIGFNAIGAAWAQVTMDMQWDALRAAQGINTALSTIRDRTVTITTIHRTVTSKVAGKRAEGGPVTGGLSYLVGERGPERFTPNVSGYVSPGAGRGGGGPQPIVIKNTVHLSRREVTTAVAEDVFREVRRRVGG